MVRLVWYFACPFCNKSEIKVDKSKGQCADCTLPFSLIKHHGKGLCLRCHTKQLRYKRKHI